ncbi:MAG: TIGR03936 family radical SAM-associated protein [Oscillospiraceae bacterium]
MDNLRLRFAKTGRAIYISHLDLMRTMQRSFLRAGLSLKYSEGFNPHAQLTFALPMSLGIASHCELMDFKAGSFMSLAEISYRLNKSFPEGLVAYEAYEAETKFKNIRWLDVNGCFEYDTLSASDLIPQLMDFFARDSLVIQKRTKSGMNDADIAPAIRSISFDTSSKGVSFKAIVSAQEPTLNPEHLVTALRQLAPELVPNFATFERAQLYDSDMNIFR